MSTEKCNACLKNGRTANEALGECVVVRLGGELLLHHVLDGNARHPERGEAAVSTVES